MKESEDKLSDQELVHIILSGNKDAYSTIVDRYKDSLASFISSTYPGIQDKEDICQESFNKAYLSLKSYNPSYAFTTWLYSIAKNTAIDHHRRKGNITSVSLKSDDDDDPHYALDSINSPEDNMIENQSYTEILGTIQNMDPMYKEVAELRFIQEFAYEEISKKLNIPLNTVKTRLHRAKSILSKKITQDES